MAGQKERILDYMERCGSITQREALDNLGVARLASRIDELRQLGYPILTVRVDGLNKFGERVHWAKYSLRKTGENKAQTRRAQMVERTGTRA